MESPENRETCREAVGDAAGVEDCVNALPCPDHERCAQCGRERWAHSDHPFGGKS